MDTAAPQVPDLTNTLADASDEHVEEIIKALKALPQCIKASAEATNMSTTSKVVKLRSKKVRAKQEYVTEEEVESRYPSTVTYFSVNAAIEMAGDDLLGTLILSTPGKKVIRSALNRQPLGSRRAAMCITISDRPGRCCRSALSKSSASAEDILMRKQLRLAAQRECARKRHNRQSFGWTQRA